MAVTQHVATASTQAAAFAQRRSNVFTAPNLTARRQQQHIRQRSRHTTSAGIGFTPDSEPSNPSPRTVEPSPYGLTPTQMAVLGLTHKVEPDPDLIEPQAELLRASAHYGGEFSVVNEATRIVTRMSAGAGPGQAPPDLPSLILDARICYIGMPLVPAVTELVISELLWLGYHQPEKPVYMYINSPGSQTELNETVAFETEAYAIMDTCRYIRPDIYTLVIGQALGTAAMLLASGKKGSRWALPNARIMTCPPRINRTFGSTSNIMIKANDLEYHTQVQAKYMARFCDKTPEEMRKDLGRNRWFTPDQAIEYGLIDKVVKKGAKAIEKRDYESMLAASQARQGGQRASSGAEAGY